MTKERLQRAKEIISEIELLQFNKEELAIKNWSDIYIQEKIEKQIDELEHKLYNLNQYHE